MKYTEKEILDALKVIKATCKEFARCEECPLYLEDVDEGMLCAIRRKKAAPSRWKLNNSSDIWRAFV